MKLICLLMFISFISCEVTELKDPGLKSLDSEKISEIERASQSCVSALQTQYSWSNRNRVYTGRVRQIILDEFDELNEVFEEVNTVSTFEATSGESFELEGSNINEIEISKPVILQISNSPSSINRFSFRNLTNDSEVKNCFRSQLSQLSREMSVRAGSANTKNIGIFYSGNERAEVPKDSLATKIESYFNEVGNGRWNATVRVFKFPFSVDPAQCSDSPNSCLSGLNQQGNTFLNSIGANDIDYKAFIGGGSGGSAGGWGQMPGEVSISFFGNFALVAHEISHNIGLHHANEWRSGSSAEYGDDTTVMGTGPRQYNSRELVRLGIHNPDRLIGITSTRKVFLAPIEYASGGLGQNIFQIATVNKNGDTMYIAARGGSEVPFGFSGSESRKIHLHASDPANRAKSLLVAQIGVGESATYNGMKVKLISISGSTFEVDVYYNLSDPAPGGGGVGDPICTGSIPQNSTVCSGDQLGLTVDTPYSIVASCTSNKKCEATCKAGFVISDDGLSCIDETISGNYQCTGNIPANSVLCDGDGQNLSKDYPKKLVQSCSTQLECEYICKPGYTYSFSPLTGASCRQDSTPPPPSYSCTGTTPANSVLCSGDDQNLTSDLIKKLVSSCTTRKCEYRCKSGFSFNSSTSKCEEIVTPPSAVNIVLSKSSYGGASSSSYSFANDNIYYLVEGAGANAKACVQYLPAAGGTGNWGACEVAGAPFSSMQGNNEWSFDSSTGDWTLFHDLTGHPYYVPGQYKIFWKNPDTGSVDSFSYTLY